VADGFDPEAVSFFFFKVSSFMAPRFLVSKEAMRIRLEQMGLLAVQRAEVL
jgi:hypothetical protein